MNTKHRTTPVAPAPRPRSKVSDRPPAHVLKAPIVVVSTAGEFEHERGGLVLGRGQVAHVVIDDPLISRHHARLVVQPDESVIVEDLHSTNGVFVNGVRLARPSCRLSEGDRLLLGTTEVSVFSSRASATVPVEHVRIPLRTGQALGEGFESAPSGSHAVAVLGASSAKTSRPGAKAGGLSPTTDRSSAVELVGQLAQRLMQSGRAVEAIRVLSDHLNNVLLGVSAGLAVSEPILEHASLHALELSVWTSRGAWVDYVFQLHLSCQRVPSDRSLDRLETALRAGLELDVELANYYVSSLQARSFEMSRDDQLRLARVVRMLPRRAP